MAVTFSPLQTAIFDHAKNSPKHLVVQARAGSGKTFTATHMFKYIPDRLWRRIFVAFNKHIQLELQSRLPAGATAVTYHSLGFSAVRKANGTVKVNSDKVDNLLRNRLPQHQKFVIPSVKRLLSACKNNLNSPTQDYLEDAAMVYNVDLFDGDIPFLIYDMVDWAYDECKQVRGEIDFDDMIWLPIVNNYSLEPYDFMVVDEAQDTNASQLELVFRTITEEGKLVGVGDSWQSIYAFRGAASDALDRIVQRMDADQLPLSITYRCPRKIVELINTEFPEIEFVAAENAKEGEILTVSNAQAQQIYTPGDMVLCRVNAPLIGEALSLIRRGIPAMVKGREIGKGLQALIKKMHTYDVTELYTKLADYHAKEGDRLARAEKFGMLHLLDDKIETLYAIMDGANSIDEINNRCDMLFGDDVRGVCFSSVHKAKGLEANRVLILKPELMPHPKAKRADEQQQERNIRYVAETRTLDKLYFVQ